MFNYNIFARFAQLFNNSENDAPTGADAVVTDYQERQELSERQKRVSAAWDDVERIADEGYFNSVTVANIHFDLGEFGENVVTVNLEDELPEFMEALNLEIQDLEWLVGVGEEIPMIRESGEWRIEWEALGDWDLYSENTEEEEDQDE